MPFFTVELQSNEPHTYKLSMQHSLCFPFFPLFLMLKMWTFYEYITHSLNHSVYMEQGDQHPLFITTLTSVVRIRKDSASHNIASYIYNNRTESRNLFSISIYNTHPNTAGGAKHGANSTGCHTVHLAYLLTGSDSTVCFQRMAVYDSNADSIPES